MFSNILLGLLVLWATHRYGQCADERCIKVPLIENFNLQKLLGDWYCQEIGDEDESIHTCLQFNLTSSKNGILFAQRIYNGLHKSQPLKAFQVGSSSEFTCVWKGRTKSSWAIGTDYKSWSTWYICNPEETDKGTLFILTREKNPKAATMEKARDSARKLGFNLNKAYLKTVDLSKCDKIEP